VIKEIPEYSRFSRRVAGLSQSDARPALIASGTPTRAVPAMKPEATAIGRSATWPLENNLNV